MEGSESFLILSLLYVCVQRKICPQEMHSVLILTPVAERVPYLRVWTILWVGEEMSEPESPRRTPVRTGGLCGFCPSRSLAVAGPETENKAATRLVLPRSGSWKGQDWPLLVPSLPQPGVASSAFCLLDW